MVHHSEQFLILVQEIHVPRSSWVQKAQSFEVTLSQLQIFCHPRGTVLYGLWGAMGTGRVFLGIIPLKRSCSVKLQWVPFPCFCPELSPWNPAQQPCHGSMWDRPRGEGGRVKLLCPGGLSTMYKEYSNDLISQQSCFQRSFQMPTKRQFLLAWHNFHLIFFFLKGTVHSWLQAFLAYLGVNTINLGLSNVFTSSNVSFDYFSHEERHLILENSCNIFHTVQEISLHLTQHGHERESDIMEGKNK